MSGEDLGPGARDSAGSVAPGAGDPDLDDAAARLLADATVEGRVTQRRRTRWLTRQAAESATFGGLLDDLVEMGRPVMVRTRSNPVQVGHLRVVGRDVVALASSDGLLHLVALSQVVAVEQIAQAQPWAMTPGPPRPGTRPGLRQLLAELADDEPDATITLDGGGTLRGRLAWVGEDLVAVSHRGPGERGGWTYVRLSSLSIVSVMLSELRVSG